MRRAMVEKPTAIISSTGRTGTLFFARLLGSCLHDATAVHEPDIFHFSIRKGKGLRNAWRQLRRSGFMNLVVRKSLGRWCLVSISDRRLKGGLTDERAVEELLRVRGRYIESRAGGTYVESNLGYYGVIDLLPRAFESHRLAYVVRDGRDWVRSKVNWGDLYGKGPLRSLFAHLWPQASEFEDDPWRSRWPRMDRFQKCCWAWAKLNGYAAGLLERNPDAKLYHFEDLFVAEDRLEEMRSLLTHLLGHTDLDPPDMDTLRRWMSRKIHSSEKGFPAWPEWSEERRETFHRMCGPLMGELGYDTEVYPITFVGRSE